MPVVWDFDYSLLIATNSDTWIPKHLYPEAAAFIRAGSAAGTQWTVLMDQTLALLHAQGIPASAIAAAAAQLPVDEDILGAVRALRAAGVPQFILSDANSLYIASFLSANALTPCFAAVHTNPAREEASGRVSVGPYHSPPPGCARCPPNLCKGRALEEALRPAAPEGGKWVYVGDGGGDACPCLRLSAGDVVLAREGWELDKRLKGEQPAARVVTWATGQDLAEALRRELLT